MKKYNIVIFAANFGWGGGVDFIRLFLTALAHKSKTVPMNLYLLFAKEHFYIKLKKKYKFNKRIVEDLINFKIPILHNPSKGISKRNLTHTFLNVEGNFRILFYDGRKKSLIKLLAKIDATVILPSLTLLGKDFPFPWVGHIYDFQHKYLPELFTTKHIKQRDEYFTQMIDQAKAIIVNSKSVKNNIDKFFPDHNSKIFSLPFTPMSSPKWFDKPIEGLINKYKLPEKYFMISNQFFYHKDHLTAFRALSILHKLKEFSGVSIVCTGKTEDERFPQYFKEVKGEIDVLGLKQYILILGYIPKLDQIQIMKQSIAVIQPTLFEGGPGGGAIYDAISVGITAIVSDIPVNREISKDDVVFFKKGSAEDLSEKMKIVIKRHRKVINKSTLLSKEKECIDKFADLLLEAINYVI